MAITEIISKHRYQFTVPFPDVNLTIQDFGCSKDHPRIVRLFEKAWSEVPDGDKALLIENWAKDGNKMGRGVLEVLHSWSGKQSAIDICGACLSGSQMRISADAFDLMDDDIAVVLIKEALAMACALADGTMSLDYDRFWRWWDFYDFDLADLDEWVEENKAALEKLDLERDAALDASLRSNGIEI